MPTSIVVPELGESIVEARVGKWLKKEGDAVAVGEALVELETDKIDLEVGASHAGVLARIDRQAGEDVKIGEQLGLIEDAAASTSPGPAAGAAPAAPAQPATPTIEAPSPAAPATAPAKDETPSRATPTARKIAEEHEIDLSGIKGSGAGGRVTRQDVEGHLKTKPAAQTVASSVPAPSAPAPAEPERTAQQTAAPAAQSAGSTDGRVEERVRMSKRRLTIARRLVEAQHTAAMLTTFNEIDMSAVQELRKRRKESFKQQHGVSLGLTSFFVKASIVALRDFPKLNAEIQGEEMVLKKYFDIGIAVGAAGGLVVPVLRNADRMSFAQIEQGVREFAKKADEGSLSLEDLRGGTFTITNGGVFGSLLSTPILNPPQVGILGLHKIEDRVVPVAGQVVIRPMMYVALSYDHRIVDGLEAVQFLVRIKEVIEDPGVLLLVS